MDLVLTRGGGGGVQNPENLADVICEWPPRQLETSGFNRGCEAM